MMLMRTIVSLASLGALALVGANVQSREVASSSSSVIETPAAPDSGMYSLAAGADGHTYLSWIETSPDKTATLRFARLDGRTWGPARTVASGRDWFVNWADHPSLTADASGTLYAHWLVQNPGSTAYGYGIRIARSNDSGITWREIFNAGTSYTSDYAGFVSLLPEGRELTAVYLTPTPPSSFSGTDGTHEGDHVKSVAAARFGADGTVVSDTVVDADACTCCPTAAVRTTSGLVAAYRDHTGPVRDISVVRNVDGRWSSPARVHVDNWTINACPTNGPALAAAGRRVAITWFTAANDVPRVRLAFSADSGVTFGSPLQLDGGNPVGWTGVVMLDDGSAVVSWLEATGKGEGEIRLRRATTDGRIGPSITIAPAKAGRLSGVPQLARVGQDLLVAWRDGKVRTALVSAPPLVAGSTSARH